MANDTIYFGLDGCLTDVATEVIAGSFALAAGPAIDTDTDVQQNCTIAYTGVGVYTITLYKAFTAPAALVATLQSNTAASLFLQVGATDVVTAKTIVINGCCQMLMHNTTCIFIKN